MFIWIKALLLVRVGAVHSVDPGLLLLQSLLLISLKVGIKRHASPMTRISRETILLVWFLPEYACVTVETSNGHEWGRLGVATWSWTLSRVEFLFETIRARVDL